MNEITEFILCGIYNNLYYHGQGIGLISTYACGILSILLSISYGNKKCENKRNNIWERCGISSLIIAAIWSFIMIISVIGWLPLISGFGLFLLFFSLTYLNV